MGGSPLSCNGWVVPQLQWLMQWLVHRFPFFVLVVPRFSFGECFCVVNVEDHAARCRTANAAIIGVL